MENKETETLETMQDDPSGEQTAAAQPAGENAAADEVSNQVDPVLELEKKVQDLENRLLRAQADFDNFRRRSRAEKEDLGKYATSKLLTQLLPVLDNFALAMGSQTNDAESLKKGIEMVFRHLETVLEQEGLTVMEAVGKPFDPNFHEAVMQVEQEGTEAGIVVDELRKGYLLKDKVLRPAMVRVSV